MSHDPFDESPPSLPSSLHPLLSTLQFKVLQQLSREGLTIQTNWEFFLVQTAGLLFCSLSFLIFILALEQMLELLARKTNL